MAHTQQTYPEQTYTFGAPGLDEKPPSSYMNGLGPNCDACKETYLERPLFSPCDTCAQTFEQMLAIEAVFTNDSDNAPPGLRTDPGGGLFLKLV